jgi:RNA polymerase sigma factor (sigma-70 family)
MFTREMALERVRRVIREELTEQQREVILAYYFQEKKIPQIAEERGVQKSTVSRTLHRAEQRLKRYLKY